MVVRSTDGLQHMAYQCCLIRSWPFLPLKVCFVTNGLKAANSSCMWHFLTMEMGVNLTVCRC
uniref:Uncharacterized protein n=1 Tax=Rhizophora mucronata TaxID=61149 RepID=A0A2P2PMX7_RHIMU